MPYKDSPDVKYAKDLAREWQKINPGPIELAVRKFVTEKDVTDPKKLAIAEIAYSLARVLDVDASNSSANISKELREILELLMDGKSDFLNDLSEPM